MLFRSTTLHSITGMGSTKLGVYCPALKVAILTNTADGSTTYYVNVKISNPMHAGTLAPKKEGLEIFSFIRLPNDNPKIAGAGQIQYLYGQKVVIQEEPKAIA